MKIQSSTVLLTSNHIAVEEYTKSESLKIWVGNKPPADSKGFAGRAQPGLLDSLNLSRQAQSAMQSMTKHEKVKSAADEIEQEAQNNPIIEMLRMLIESLSGKKIKVTSSTGADKGSETQGTTDTNQSIVQDPAPAQQQPPTGAGFGLEYDAQEYSVEAERTNFAAQGAVQTTDGKQISFQMQLSMERAYASEKSVSIRLGDAAKQVDPLVINFNGTAAQLTDTKFSFDINSDGNAKQISFVGPNSGFIAFDKNNDGVINNGSELFGTKSGDGFLDLSAYDQDKNGWIDSNDPVFSQLKVWSKDAKGNDSLTGLEQMGIGALYLGKTATPFELKDGSNSSLGTVRSSGVYLNENGSAGTLQQVDLTA